MKFYKEIVQLADDPHKRERYHYHEWSPDSIAQYWNIWTHNPLLQRQFYPQEYWRDLLAWADQQVAPKPATIVDVGCGGGNLVDQLRGLYRDAVIYGVDLSEQSLQPAQARFRNDARIRFKVGSLDNLPIENASIDLVTCTEVLEHTFPETFEKSFSEVGRVLKTGGHYLATVPFAESLALVCCPECRSVFTPYQHMNFEISHGDIAQHLAAHDFELMGYYTSIDRSRPRSRFKAALKPMVIKWFPRTARRLFPKAGVSGFLARAANRYQGRNNE